MDAASSPVNSTTSGSAIQPWHFWYCCILALCGAGTILYGAWQSREAKFFVAHAMSTQASVVDYKVWPPSKHQSTSYQPIVRFVDPAGNSWQKPVGVARPHREFPVGHAMNILYLPAHPGDFKLDDPEELRGYGGSLMGVGAFALLLFSALALFVRSALGHPEQNHLRWWDRWFVPIKLLLRLLDR